MGDDQDNRLLYDGDGGPKGRSENIRDDDQPNEELSKDGFEQFVRRRGAHLTRFAYLLVADQGRAEDLVQTALVRTWLRGDRVAPEGREAYVRRTMVTTAVSWWRRGDWRERLTSALPDLVAAPDATAVVDERDLLLAALRRLPPRQRAAVVLRHYAALTEAETADLLHCSVGTVKSQTSRGLAALRGVLATIEAALEGERT